MRSILIVRVGGIGDTLALLPVIQALRSDRPDIRVTLLLSSIGADLLRPVFDGLRIISVERSALSGIWGLRSLPGLVLRLVSPSFRKYDTALVAFDETTVCHIVAACVARRRIGFSSGINRGDRFLTDTLVFHPKQSVYETLYDLARCVDGVAPTMPRPKLPGRYLAAFRYGEIHTHASTSLQVWEEAASLVPDLERVCDFPWIVRRGPDDGRDVTDFVKSLAGAHVAITMHSGPLHVAAALGVPVIGLAGPTAPAWDPPGAIILRRAIECQPCGRIGRPARMCWRGDQVCLSGFSPSDVFETVQSLLCESL